MQPISLDDLHADPKNPRLIKEKELTTLKTLLYEFGDLSGIVRNSRTDQLVGGHRRVDAFRAQRSIAQVQITQRFEVPTRTRTVAVGYVILDGEPYTYREVDWDEGRQHAANIAANKAAELAEWDKDLLAQLTYEMSQLDNGEELLGLTALGDDDIKNMLAMVSGEPDIALPDGDKDGFQQVTYTLSDAQAEIVREATENIKATQSFDGSENSNSNGNALFYLAQNYLDNLHGTGSSQ